MHAESRLPVALTALGLLPGKVKTSGVHVYPPASDAIGRTHGC
jgi:hypothetical protein